ncbi:MAG: hypothetical protein GF317_00590 [Candidatus Lokiarchaeota archaeon]|nr:hypothetical protein [Candidatus Lokiarchaeota archaeon]MBD3198472.1 hypothetical protein [Candidatus Lokiarchaeota archaeon]
MSLERNNIEKSKTRLKAWWNNEETDRPCIGFDYPFYNKTISSISELMEFYISFCLAKNPDGIEQCIKRFEDLKEKIYSGGDNFYSYRPNYGAGATAAVLGIEPEYRKGSDKYGYMAETVWYQGEISIDDLIPYLNEVYLDESNKWYKRFLRVTEYAAKKAKDKYNIAILDIGGVLDVLSSLVGPQKLILAMRKKPEIIEKACSLLLEIMLELYDDLQSIIDKYCDGSNSWINIWCPTHYYPVQCDFAAMLNPRWFKRFALPFIKRQAEHLDHAIYHLDGENQLVHLDDLLALDCIDGIQWVPGAGKEITASMKWMPLYEKIQASGKKVVLNAFEDPTLITQFYERLDSQLLYLSCFFMDKIRAEFYLPEFVGGKAGNGNFRKYKRKRKNEIRNSQ